MNVSKKLLLVILSSTTIAFSGASHAKADTKASQEVASKAISQENIQPVNINASDVAQLQTLKGVGSHRAEAIVQYRNEIGKYTSIEQLTAVKGIGLKIIEDNKGRITL